MTITRPSLEAHKANRNVGDNGTIKSDSVLAKNMLPEHREIVSLSDKIPATSHNDEVRMDSRAYNKATLHMYHLAPRLYNQPRPKVRRQYSPQYIPRAQRAKVEADKAKTKLS
ncbi:hypothetical protein K491DRAFT_784129 [Lophiostoma macrostomum CBS 122681]|uniref:Uncharacterized protein n=1 Tax=Lophiostoma macrostomum CBS 122681 TaxID=1314788 RepID=A0A6A6SPP6_9PLEO|nr:hypothetical protein K491DRAFT_784129 [Lophiostoma macrostomum CBS 122681]